MDYLYEENALKAGYKTIVVSASTKDGLVELFELIKGKTVAFENEHVRQ